jgi:XTP/dITP diphosphohydrolase
VQTHDSLRQYLVEETYELLEAIEDGDREALREELGDVLLQVLFHARVAAEHETTPFDMDAVATDLVDKLVGRHPHVFSDEVLEYDAHDRRWDELKQAEKRRESSVDGVALGQPAVALAAKLASRVSKAGLPVDLLPGGDDTGATLFGVAAVARLAGEDPEGELRTVARRFGEDVRAAETAAKQAGVDPSAMTAEDWRRHWPKAT